MSCRVRISLCFFLYMAVMPNLFGLGVFPNDYTLPTNDSAIHLRVEFVRVNGKAEFIVKIQRANRKANVILDYVGRTPPTEALVSGGELVLLSDWEAILSGTIFAGIYNLDDGGFQDSIHRREIGVRQHSGDLYTDSRVLLFAISDSNGTLDLVCFVVDDVFYFYDMLDSLFVTRDSIRKKIVSAKDYGDRVAFEDDLKAFDAIVLNAKTRVASERELKLKRIAIRDLNKVEIRF